LQTAGGLLLLLVALQLLTGELDDPAKPASGNVAMVPLGTPLLAGPGAIVATMVFVQRSDEAADYLAVATAIIAVHALLWIFMRYSVVILRILRESGILLLTRIAGLLLAAIAVQLVADAVRAFVEGT
jgi:multiple antibiotic resistance protein